MQIPDTRHLQARTGVYQAILKPPFVGGYEISGVVVTAGEGVEDFMEGDEVVALSALDNPHGVSL